MERKNEPRERTGRDAEDDRGAAAERYEDVFGESTRSGNKAWMIKRIAWRLQANAYGGLSERAKARAAELANDADVR